MKVLIVSHGNLSHELKKTAEMIVGKREEVITFGLQPEASPESFKEEILKEIEDNEAMEFLVLVDILGGTPFNSLVQVLGNKNIEIVIGFNLGMLLEILLNMDNKSLFELSQYAKEKGLESILTKSDLLKQF
ncbi:MAG: PTS sugar transporter subunit IIA [Erysipelotrichaceae bacterium]